MAPEVLLAVVGVAHAFATACGVESGAAPSTVLLVIELTGDTANRLPGGELIPRLVDAVASPAPRDE